MVRKSAASSSRNNNKHRGTMAEMQFMFDAAERGFGVAKPFVDNERYDVIVDASRHLWRVQVKMSGTRHRNGFSVQSHWLSGNQPVPYTADQIDFLAVTLQCAEIPGRIWYLIPVQVLGRRLKINLYPFGCRNGGQLRFEKYRAAWQLLNTGKACTCTQRPLPETSLLNVVRQTDRR